MTEDKIDIELSKSKMTLLLMGAISFVVLGILFILNPAQFENSRFDNPVVIRTVGIASVLFFGLCLVFIVKKLFDGRIGLTIDKNGITDNSNATSVGLIAWTDITNIKTLQIASTKVLMLETDNPQKYIDRAKNSIAKGAMKTNYKLYGSPLSISASSLKIRHAELEELIRNEFTQRTK
ncbi:STM3941 family protein [Roseivirga sp.]|uniref:STM3941 family protein n=1 Tax=Roseivirga sp. TaxID=1964215 RepID=UPI003B51D5E1